MTEDHLASLTEMLRIIQQNDSPEEYGKSDLVTDAFNSLTPKEQEELLENAKKKKQEAKEDPRYAFTQMVISVALTSMIPLMSREKPFDTLMDELGLSSYLVKKNLAEVLLNALKMLPEDLANKFMEDSDNGANFLALLTYVFMQAIYLAGTASDLKEQKG